MPYIFVSNLVMPEHCWAQVAGPPYILVLLRYMIVSLSWPTDIRVKPMRNDFGSMDEEGMAADAEVEPDSSKADDGGESGHAPSVSRSFKVLHPVSKKRRWLLSRKSEKPRREVPDSVTNLRALPLLGAVLGLSSFALPWDSFTAFERESFHRLGDYVFMYPSDYTLLLAISAAVVLIGSVLMFITSLGSVVQLSGLLLFIIGMPGSFSELEIGFVVCLCGAVLGCGSLVIRTPLAVPQRFLTITMASGEDGRLQVGISALLCFAVGAIGCALPWFVDRLTWRYNDYVVRSDMVYSSTILNFIFDLDTDLLVVTGASLFVIGTLLAILTSLSGVVQGAGLISFFVGVQPRFAESSLVWGYDSSSTLGIGYFIGIVAVAIGIVSLFFPLRVDLPMKTVSWAKSTPSQQHPKNKFNDLPSTLGGILRRALPFVLAMMLVLSSMVVVAGLAYTQKWSSVLVYVSIYAPSEEEVEVAVYVDDVPVLEDLTSSWSQVIAKSSVTAGTHKISIDYCFMSLESQGIDGTADWSTWCHTRPFTETRVQAQLGSYWATLNSISVEASPVENGTKVVFGDFEWNGLWPGAVSWDEITLALTDGISTVAWRTSTADLDADLLSEKTYDTRTIGGVNVSCTVTDIYGNGYINPGDFVVFTATDETSFSAEVAFVLYVIHDVGGDLVAECELDIG